MFGIKELEQRLDSLSSTLRDMLDYSIEGHVVPVNVYEGIKRNKARINDASDYLREKDREITELKNKIKELEFTMEYKVGDIVEYDDKRSTKGRGAINSITAYHGLVRAHIKDLCGNTLSVNSKYITKKVATEVVTLSDVSTMIQSSLEGFMYNHIESLDGRVTTLEELKSQDDNN